MIYHNPVIPGFHPDPTVCRAGDVFYLATSSFEYFPGVPIYSSRDLVNWRQIGHALTRKTQLDLAGVGSSQGIFAPTLRFHRGRFYMITTCVGGRGHFFVSTEDPRGPWSEPVFIQGNGFDPDLFFDDDGSAYFTRQDDLGGGILQWRIDLETGALLGEASCLWRGFEDRYCEGPHVYKRNGKYLLLAAEGGTHTGHMVVAGLSDRPDGPYIGVDRNPVLSHRGRVDSPIQATGHADIVEGADGSWWMVFLGIRQIGDWFNGRGHLLGRETFLAPIDWSAAGEPIVNGGRRIELEMPAPSFCAQENSIKETELVDFRRGILPLSFNTRGNISPEAVKISAREGRLVIRPSRGSLDEAQFPSFIGRRQAHYSFECEAALEFDPRDSGEEAGMTVLMNERHHYDLIISRTEAGIGQRMIRIRRKAGDMAACTDGIPIPDGPIRLRIEGDRTRYAFSYSIGDSADRVALGGADSLLLSSETAGGFTGVYIGLFASSQAGSSTPAYCSDFSYRGEA